MSIYRGERYQEAGPLVVTKDGEALSPAASQKVYNHSPDGFQWGYGGSGPAQLALALLIDVGLKPAVAVRYHQAFKRDFVAKWGERWQLTTEEINRWLEIAASAGHRF